MNFKQGAMIFGAVFLLIIMGGVGYKIVAPTSKTVVGKGGKVVNLNTSKPQIPLGGCSLYRINAKAYWEQEYKK